MAKDFYSKLENLLKKNSHFIDQEGGLLKSNIIDSAYKADKKLVESLLSQEEFKSKFFSKIKDVLVFNINDFVVYISDKNFLANSYTKYCNKIGLNINSKFLNERKEVALVWPFKDCVLEGGMIKEDEKRKEIFFNEILAQDEIDKLLAPKVLTNWKKYSEKGEEKVRDLKRDDNGTIRENLIIKGNNLLALHSLKQQFQNKIKLIYIDPPYNREIDGFYNDNFKHSSWLTFMKNRIEVAVAMLKDDGVIFVQCDDNEYPYLKVLMDEVDGVKYELTYYVQVRYAQKTLAENSNYQKLIEHVLCYSKQNFKPHKPKVNYEIDKFCWNITELKSGKLIELGGKMVEIFKPGEYKIEKVKPNLKALKEVWATGTLLRTTAKFFRDHLMDRKNTDGLGILYKVVGIGKDGLGYRYFTGPLKATATKGKYYSGIPADIANALSNGDVTKELVINNFYDMSDAFGNCRHEGGVELRSGKKPERWLKTLLDYGSKPGDIVMDFFLGTGGTCAVAHKSKRQYVGIEQLDYGKNDSVIRLKNVINGDLTGISDLEEWKGGGNFVYCELMKYNEQFVNEIKKAKNIKELLKIWTEMKIKSFLNYNVDIKKFDETIEEFKKLSLTKQKHILFDVLNKNQLYVNLSEIKDVDFEISKGDKDINKKFYSNI